MLFSAAWWPKLQSERVLGFFSLLLLLNAPQRSESPQTSVFTRSLQPDNPSSLDGDGFIFYFKRLLSETGLNMVKVTFNSALAQKELKKGEKDEALIPQDGVSWAKFTKATETYYFT